MLVAKSAATKCLKASRRAMRRGDVRDAERWLRLAALHVRVSDRLWKMETEKMEARRGYRAWRNKQTINLEYRTSDGLQNQAPIVAARYVEMEEGQLLLLWVRLVDDQVELELGYEDDSDEESDDDFDLPDFSE